MFASVEHSDPNEELRATFWVVMRLHEVRSKPSSLGQSATYPSARALCLIEGWSSLAGVLLTCLALRAVPAQTPALQTPSTNLHQWGAVTLFHGLPSDHVRAIAQDREGFIWFGTDNGLARYDGRRVQKITAEGLPLGGVRAIKIDDDGALRIGTASGTVRLIDGEFKPVADSDARGPSPGARTTVDQSAAGQSRETMRPPAVPAREVTALTPDQNGNLWIVSDGHGAFLYRGSRQLEHFTFENTAGGLRSNHIYAVFVDREGVIWFGTDRGACRYDPNSLRIEAVSDRPESNFARALFQSRDGWIWCGTNRGLFVRDKSADRWVEVPELRGHTVHSIAEDAPEHLLVGTASGLFTGAKPTTRQRRARGVPGALAGSRLFTRVKTDDRDAGSVRAICEFQGSFYIAGFGRGLERLERDRRTLVWANDSLVSLHSDDGKRLWIGAADGGVLVLDGKEVRRDAALDGLSNETAWSIGGTSDGVLWVAVPRGLAALRAGELLWPLKGNDVRRVTAKGDAAWCVTAGGGLYKVLLDEGGEAIVARLDTEQGLPSENAFAILSTTGASGEEVLWVGTSHGVARYVPGRVAPQLRAARVMSKRVFQPDEIRAGLDLDYPQNSLALDVEALSGRTFPEQFQYSFSLLDSAGRPLRHKLARDSQFLIENLTPGRYRIEARAFTNDLVVSEPLALEFRVARAPFPWTTTALAALLGLALVAMWWGHRQNKRMAASNVALGDANRQLAETRMQLANETETERRRIARDLHDQTLADLRRLLLMTDQLPAREGDERRDGIEPAVFRNEIEAVSTEIRRICEDLSPSALANVGLAAALEWAVADAVAHMPAEGRFEYEFACDEAIEEKLRLAPAVQIQVYRIVQEAISNVCRHSGATHVRLEVSCDSEGRWVIRLEDNGRGFDAAARSVSNGRGLANIRSRASLIEAEVEWGAQAGGGTVFSVWAGRR